MIKVKKKTFLNPPEGSGLVAGKEYYVLNYRKGVMYFEHFPDRCSFTINVWLKKLYSVDDAIYLFDATDKKNFRAEQKRIVEQIDELIDEFEEKLQPYPEGSNIHFIISSRIQVLNEWKSRVRSIKAVRPIINSVKKIRNQHPLLK